uniref:Uncharacterized protein n=1 Tax=Rhizophora mucronata TaxID=61149 RepID=A0A2P2IL64_RHIMU
MDIQEILAPALMFQWKTLTLFVKKKKNVAKTYSIYPFPIQKVWRLIHETSTHMHLCIRIKKEMQTTYHHYFYATKGSNYIFPMY